MKLNANLIADILANTLIPADQAARFGPRADELISRFCSGPVEQMKLMRRIDQNTLSRDELLDLADLICRIEKWLDFARTAADKPSKSNDCEYLELADACDAALSTFDAELIPERYSSWRQATH